MFNFFVDESSFGMSQAIQKCMKLTRHPNLMKKIGKPGVFPTFVREILPALDLAASKNKNT